ncbi:ARM repeat protein interacting with ABF2 [Hibiscus trionum]|uniref:ARM repeat protein interacting with ABF2 n=1 Tax=Hibiscus trionum TaxID=183268 RepID=A0A9W7LI36_HIBTR|nr:ARM repeat protein interacting with ABF2 [Hibiscus trionum]
MELQRCEDQGLHKRKGQKRKLEEEIQEDRDTSLPTGDPHRVILAEVADQVSVLDSAFSWSESDRASAKRATHVLAELAKNGKSSNSPASDLVRIYIFIHSFCSVFTVFEF